MGARVSCYKRSLSYAFSIFLGLGMKRKREKKTHVVYQKGAIPYHVSQPNRFWRIKKDLPADQYWKKRYWRRRITGRGDYKFSSSRSTGANWGGYLGSKAGEFLGGAAQNLAISMLSGLGDYKVKKNVFLGGNMPQIVNDPSGGGTVIRFQEYLTDIITGTAGDFNLQSFILNPANSNTFPWLSQVAANYEQYEFEGLVFGFKSTSADALNSTNTALGSVMMATQYDTMDRVFSSKGEMLNYEFSTSCKPSSNNLHMIECAPSVSTLTTLYTLASEEVPDGADPRLYNLGRFSIATTGFQADNVNIGELHVTYQIRLLKPKLFTTLGDGVLWYSMSTPTFSAGVYPCGLESDATALENTIGVVNGGTSITFPATTTKKVYRMNVMWVGSVAAAVIYPVMSITNGTYGTIRYAPVAGTSSTSVCGNWAISTNDESLATVVTFGTGGTLPTGTGYCFITIIEQNPSD